MARGILALSEDELDIVIDYLPPRSILPFALTCRQLYAASKPALIKDRTLESQFAILNLAAYPFTDPLVLDPTLYIQPPGYHPVQILELCLQTPVILKYVRKVRILNNKPQRQKYAQPNPDGTQPRTKFFSATGELHRLQPSRNQRRIVSTLADTLRFNKTTDEQQQQQQQEDDDEENDSWFDIDDEQDADSFHQSLTVLLSLLTNLETINVCCPDGFDNTQFTLLSDFLAHRKSPLSTLSYHPAVPIPSGSIAHNIHTLSIRGQHVNVLSPEIDLSTIVHILCLPTLRTLDCEGVRARQDFTWPVDHGSGRARPCHIETWRIDWSFLNEAALATILRNAPNLKLLEYSQPDFWWAWNPVGGPWDNPQIFLYICELVAQYGNVLREEGLVVRRRRIHGLRPHGRFQIFKKGCPPAPPAPPTPPPPPARAGITAATIERGGSGDDDDNDNDNDINRRVEEEVDGEGEADGADIEWIYGDFGDDLHIEFALQGGVAMPAHLC